MSKSLKTILDGDSREKWQPFLLVVAVLVVYLPALQAGFIWDDDDYVTENETLRSLHGLYRIWFEYGAVPQYYPLVHTTFWLEFQAWNLNPLGYHLVNVLIHAINATLLYRVLKVMNLPGAWLCSLWFGIHPVHVESVAWITERKNVLSAFFYLSAMLLFLKNMYSEFSLGKRDETADRRFRWMAYVAILVLFVCALLSKTVTCSLPATMLIIVWWKFGRFVRRDFLLTLPMFVIGFAFAIVTVVVEKEVVGAKGVEFDWTMSERILIAGRAVWFYASKLLVPYPLVFFYPSWELSTTSIFQWAFPVSAAGLVISLLLLRNRIGRGPLAAILFFGGTLVPALGFVDVYPMLYSFVADHFQYLASIGVLILMAAGCSRLASLSEGEASKLDERIPKAIVVAIVLIFSVTTFLRCFAYRDLETLWRDTIAKNPGSAAAHINLAGILDPQSELDEIIEVLGKAVEINDQDPESHYNLGNFLLMDVERKNNAITHFEKTLQLSPQFWAADLEIGKIRAAAKEYDQAITHYRRALENENEKSVFRKAWVRQFVRGDLRVQLADAMHQSGDSNGAIKLLEEAVGLFPTDQRIFVKLSEMEMDRKNSNSAIQYLRKTIELAPKSVANRIRLGELLFKTGQFEASFKEFAAALKLQPTNHRIAARLNEIRSTVQQRTK